VLTGQRVLPARALELGFRFEYPTLDAALRQILR
jgi:NAD dependent epimerase/dehydratase family enzyme